MTQCAIPSIYELMCSCPEQTNTMISPFYIPQQTINKPVVNIVNSNENESDESFQTTQKKGPWTQDEDDLLLRAVYKYGTVKWGTISKCVQGRAPNQCKERWFFRLSPDLKKTPFEEWEDSLIISLRSKYGNHWTLISSKLPGRSSCSVKNRWYTVLRKRCQE